MASSLTAPAACATPGWASTFASRDAGTVGCVPSSFLTGLAGVIATSVPLLTSVKMRENAELIVSVKT